MRRYGHSPVVKMVEIGASSTVLASSVNKLVSSVDKHASLNILVCLMQEMFMSDPIIQDQVTNIIQLSPMGHHDNKQKQHKLTFLTQCIELFFMVAGPGSSADVIGFELPLLCGSVYSTTNTTPNSKAVDFFKGSVGSTTLLYLLITWITLLVKSWNSLKAVMVSPRHLS